MKRYLCILLGCLLLFVFSGCGNQDVASQVAESQTDVSIPDLPNNDFEPWTWAQNLDKSALTAVWTQTVIHSTTKEVGENHTTSMGAQGGGLLHLDTEEPDAIIARMQDLKKENFTAADPEYTDFGWLYDSTEPNIPCNVVAFFDEENSTVVMVRQERENMDFYYTTEYAKVKKDSPEYVHFLHWKLENEDLLKEILNVQAVPQNWPYQ